MLSTNGFFGLTDMHSHYTPAFFLTWGSELRKVGNRTNHLFNVEYW